MDFTRRTALTNLVGVGAFVGVAACSGDKKTEVEFKPSATPLGTTAVKFPSLPKDLLLNRPRAHAVMKAEGVDAIICVKPQNIYYLTNHEPQLVKMGMHDLAYAILPINPAQAPILILGQFAYYLGMNERPTASLVDTRLYTSPAEESSIFAQQDFMTQINVEANPSFLPTKHNTYALPEFEAQRRIGTEKLSMEMVATSQGALVKTVKDLSLAGKRVAVDDVSLASMLESVELPIVSRNADTMLRRIRLQKSEAEIDLCRYAARENAEASLAAAQVIRDGAHYQEMRIEYARECASRMLNPSFMVIDGIIPAEVAGTISEGRSFLIDCVSEHQGYHGDYGRTVCVGEPTREITRATKAISRVWDSLLPQLKPGVRYSEISALATKAFEKENSDAALICNPHSVGLNHTDEPGKEGISFWMKDDLELVEGMVLSVDLPMVDVGLGGSGHLEDLVLIGADGAELLNDSGNRVIII